MSRRVLTWESAAVHVAPHRPRPGEGADWGKGKTLPCKHLPTFKAESAAVLGAEGVGLAGKRGPNEASGGWAQVLRRKETKQ